MPKRNPKKDIRRVTSKRLVTGEHHNVIVGGQREKTSRTKLPKKPPKIEE